MGKLTRLLAVAGCVVATAGLGAGSALAGEITGNGKWIAGSEEAPLNGRSECAFSGQNDEFVLDVPGDWDRSQSWGQIARHLEGGHRGAPGFACNPTRSAG